MSQSYLFDFFGQRRFQKLQCLVPGVFTRMEKKELFILYMSVKVVTFKHVLWIISSPLTEPIESMRNKKDVYPLPPSPPPQLPHKVYG